MEDVEPGEEERRENRRSQVSTLTLERLLQAGGGGGVRGLSDSESSKEQPERSGGLCPAGVVGWLVSSGSVGATFFVKEVNLHYGRRNSKDCKDVMTSELSCCSEIVSLWS